MVTDDGNQAVGTNPASYIITAVYLLVVAYLFIKASKNDLNPASDHVPKMFAVPHLRTHSEWVGTFSLKYSL